MKLFRLFFLFFSLSSLTIAGFTSCNDDDNNTEDPGYEKPEITSETVTISFVTEKNVGSSIKLYIGTDANSGVWIDLNGNKVLDEGEKITSLNEYAEYTIGTQYINIYGNVTQFYCDDCELVQLNVANASFLESLNCANNELNYLDLSQSDFLSTLDCSNNRFVELNAIGMTELNSFDFSNNLVETINLSTCTKLNTLNCSNNKLTDLDLTSNTSLRVVDISANQLSDIDLSSNTLLTELNFAENYFTELSISKNPDLSTIICYHNNLTEGTLVRFATSFDEDNSGGNLYLYKYTSSDREEGNADLADYYVDMANESDWKLYKMERADEWTEIVPDIDKTEYYMTFTTSKSAGSYISLYVGAYREYVSGLWIDLNNNGVKDVGEEVGANSSKAYTLQSSTFTLHGNIHTLSFKEAYLVDIDFGNSNNNILVLNIEGNQLPNFSMADVPNILELNISNTGITSIDTTGHPYLRHLQISLNPGITSIDLSQNPYLEYLAVEYCSLTSLDISNNPLLAELYCSQLQASTYKLNSIDISNQPKLYRFIAAGNNFTSLDFSNNPEMQSIFVSDNNLSSLYISHLTKLIELSIYSNYFKFSTMPYPNDGTLGFYNYGPQKNIKLNSSYAVGDTIDFSSEYDINGIITTYTLYVLGDSNFATPTTPTLTEGTDYTNNNGVITLLTEQTAAIAIYMNNSGYSGFDLRTTKFTISL